MLARIVWAAVRGYGQAKVLSLHQHSAELRLGKKVTLALHVWDEARADELARELRTVAHQGVEGMLVVGLVGGGQRARRTLDKAKPVVTKVKVGELHVDDDGKLRTRGSGLVKRVLEGFEQSPYPSEEEWAGLLERSAKGRAEHDRMARETREFTTFFYSRGLPGSLTLVVVLIAVFLLELANGAWESVPELTRMGALSREQVLHGEIWRLFSCTFLHWDWGHIYMNAALLLIIGGFVERILGSGRFLFLYFASCLGGSLFSLAHLGDGVSVGASGGLWGLLTALGVIALRPQGLLPPGLVGVTRRVAFLNLALNVMISFYPQVDGWAHLGGGLVGAALAFSGVLTQGLPRLPEPHRRATAG